MSENEVQQTLLESKSHDELLMRDPSKTTLAGFKLPEKHVMQKSKVCACVMCECVVC
jgi:hypothetical protein